MEITLDQRTIDAIAYKAAMIVVKKLREKEALPELVDTKEAARILGITPDWLRKNQDKYPHIKNGEGRNAKLMFRRDSLIR